MLNDLLWTLIKSCADLPLGSYLIGLLFTPIICFWFLWKTLVLDYLTSYLLVCYLVILFQDEIACLSSWLLAISSACFYIRREKESTMWEPKTSQISLFIGILQNSGYTLKCTTWTFCNMFSWTERSEN